MDWIPDLPGLLVTLKRLESGEDPVQNSFDLFWMFCDSSLSPDEFQKGLFRWRDQVIGPAPRGQFLDSDIDEIMHRAFEDPQGAAKATVARLDTLSERRKVPHKPDQPEDVQSLYVSAHIESARLVRLLKSAEYSQDSRSLDSALETYARCKKALGDYRNAPWPEVYSPSLKAIGSFLNITHFQMQKAATAYEEGLLSVAEGIELFQGIRIMLFPLRGKWATKFEDVRVYTVNNRLQESVSWMESLEPQAVVDCFESVRAGGRIKDRQLFASTCQRLLDLCIKTPWLKPKDEKRPRNELDEYLQPTSLWPLVGAGTPAPWNRQKEIKEVRDANGAYWEPTLFWQRANWWAESQLEPSELQTLMQHKDDDAAVARLRNYFLPDEQWELLPERAKSSLVNADREWFSGAKARTESILNELRIATEELLLHGLWEPLDEWIVSQKGKRSDVAKFLELKAMLAKKGFTPGLPHFEDICRMTVTEAFLKAKGFPAPDKHWFSAELPKSLSRLRNARRRAEHKSANKWTRPELREFVVEFLGIGQPGVLPQLIRVLFS